MLGCAPPQELSTCAGETDASIAFGSGSAEDFAPLGDLGDLTVDGGPGTWSVPLAWQFTGLGTTDGVDVLVRMWFGDGPSSDYLDAGLATCTEPGPAFFSASAPLPDEIRDDLAADLDGLEARVSGSLTDANGTTVSHDDEVTLRFP